jgi:hypothetical protein
VEAESIDEAFAAELEAELQMVRDAMVLVARGGARRVIVANLRHGRVLLEPARAAAERAGVVLQILETADPRRGDLALERLARSKRPIPAARPRTGPLPALGIARQPS